MPRKRNSVHVCERVLLSLALVFTGGRSLYMLHWGTPLARCFFCHLLGHEYMWLVLARTLVKVLGFA